MNHKKDQMLRGPLMPAVIRYTIPIILTSILQLLFNAADLAVVGWFCGQNSVAAVGSTGSLTHLFINLFIGISVGVGVTVAQGIGAGDEKMVSDAVHTALPTAVASGILLTVVGILCSPLMLHWMSTPEEVLGLSATYMRIYFAGMVFSMVYNFCTAILRAAGDTKSPLIFLTIAGVLNVGLNLIFVIVLHMNVAGVAWATTLSQGVSAVLVVWALMRRTDSCRLELKKLRFHWKPLGKMLKIGLPAGLQSSLFSISNVLIQSSVNSFGTVLMAGNAAASQIETFLYVAMNAFHQTALNFCGQNVGAGNYPRARRAVFACLACVGVMGTAVGVIAYQFAPQLLSIFITDSPEAITWGVIRMGYIFLPYSLCGLMDVSTGGLRGMGVSLSPTLISVFGICGLRIGWIMTVFRWHHTPQCLYLSYPISWTATLVAQMILFFVIYRRRVKKLE